MIFLFLNQPPRVALLVLLELLFVQLDAEPCALRKVDVAFGVNLERLGEDEVAVLRKPVRRGVWGLDVREPRRSGGAKPGRGPSHALRPRLPPATPCRRLHPWAQFSQRG